MKIRRFTKFAFVLAIVALIAGLYACDQIQQVLLPAPDMGGGLVEKLSSASTYR